MRVPYAVHVIVRFPAYRQYTAARIEVNDAMMALLIGARLGQHALSNTPASPEVLLPTLFGQISGIARLNRTAGDAAQLLADAERHLAYMAIPYALTVHSSFLVQAAAMLRDDGRDEDSAVHAIPRQEDLTKLSLETAHEYIAERCDENLDGNLLPLFDLTRRIRNRIVHFNGVAGSRLSADYRKLSVDTRAGWEELARRPLGDAIESGRLEVAEGELIAVLAISHHLTRRINDLLARTLSREYWATTAVRDYREMYPRRFAERDRRLRRVIGHASRLYAPLRLTEAELRAAGA